MVKTKRGCVLATGFLSGVAAIISLTALATQHWVTASAKGLLPTSNLDGDSIKIGLFGGIFKQTTAITITYELTTVCAFDLNVCAMLCGNNMKANLKRLYRNDYVSEEDLASCEMITDIDSNSVYNSNAPIDIDNTDKVFINAGIWLCTLIFLILSAVMGLLSAIIAVWNTAASPSQAYFNIFGLYIYNSIALFTVTFAIVLWGIMFIKNLMSNVPCYKTLLQGYSTKGYAQLGYSYWMNLTSLVLYGLSISVLYIRNYLISKKTKEEVQMDTQHPLMSLR